jgi:hypothetical protein
VGDDQFEWLAEYGQPIREQPTEAVDYDNQPLKSLENPATSKLWVAGSSPAGRASFPHRPGPDVPPTDPKRFYDVARPPGSTARGRAGSNGAKSIVFAAPSRISSAIASAVAGAFRMPQTL